MNKVVMGIIGLVVVALGAGIFVASGSDDSEQVANNTSSQSSVSTPQADDTIEVASSGVRGIQTYSSDALANSTTDNNLLFFHAAWCTVCNSVERNIEAGSIPDNLNIFKVDYDSREGQDLADKYNIPIQYSMVQVDTQGNEINQWVNQFNDGVSDIVDNLETI